ncbi:aminotransferase-like domain-containing protein [Actinacidiphila acididurans]|uniref:PLP-dependent aminotransferase family protein n=1 Tax=Actinacidiphila acididurans TaxID=2784346 RepID=A0ABS2U3K9_9ACTN|nr:PLP-dependent aminotransferase family protein [Actinacidiphila acididurans]MBM9509922.1 PLP-dependent aminotransferase family protein [Actinacidiphila acididurans]
MELTRSQLADALSDPLLDAMNFLNEVAMRFPDAISFAAGRPDERFAGLEDAEEDLRRYRAHLMESSGGDERAVIGRLFSYGPAKGMINDLVARYLRVDEGIETGPESLVVTVGAQEGMVLVLRALRRESTDVALAVAPTYAGFTGAARIVGMPVLPVASGPDGVDFDDLRRVAARARADGLRPRCLYVIPDFANPTGLCLPVADRHRLIEVGAEQGLLLIEDNPYGTYVAHGERLPTLKALDRGGQVVYLGSFAKTVMPGARVGFVVADQPVTDGGRRIGRLADELAKIKSMVTVNTSAVGQAVVGGRLLAHDCSLVRANERVAAVYRDNLDRMLRGLEARFGGRPDLSWTSPNGGFFITVRVPFRADEALLEHSARRHRILWTPMSQFYPGSDSGARSLRLSCSALYPDQIDTGLDRLAALVAEQSAPLSA